jgi:hypothetical protein
MPSRRHFYQRRFFIRDEWGKNLIERTGRGTPGTELRPAAGWLMAQQGSTLYSIVFTGKSRLYFTTGADIIATTNIQTERSEV